LVNSKNRWLVLYSDFYRFLLIEAECATRHVPSGTALSRAIKKSLSQNKELWPAHIHSNNVRLNVCKIIHMLLLENVE
jgi:hypothetical protein